MEKKLASILVSLLISANVYSQDFASFFTIFDNIKEENHNILRDTSGIVIKSFTESVEKHYIFASDGNLVCDYVKIFPYTFVDDFELQGEYNSKYKLLAPYLWMYTTKYMTVTIQRFEGDRIYYLFTLKPN